MEQHASPGCWTVAGLENTVPSGTATRTMINDSDIVLWRGQDGVARAWENRCPHRGMRLSFGLVRGNRLTCLYHGWTYDGSGNCVAIPAHPELKPPKTIKTWKYQCREVAAMIWVAPEFASRKFDPPEGQWTACRSLHIRLSGNSRRNILEDFPDDNIMRQTESFLYMKPKSLGFEVLLAMQPMGSFGTMLHVAVSGNAEASELRGTSVWVRGIRAAIEKRYII